MKEKRGERKENEDERKKINMKDKKEKVKKEDERNRMNMSVGERTRKAGIADLI